MKSALRQYVFHLFRSLRKLISSIFAKISSVVSEVRFVLVLHLGYQFASWQVLHTYIFICQPAHVSLHILSMYIPVEFLISARCTNTHIHIDSLAKRVACKQAVVVVVVVAVSVGVAAAVDVADADADTSHVDVVAKLSASKQAWQQPAVNVFVSAYIHMYVCVQVFCCMCVCVRQISRSFQWAQSAEQKSCTKQK